MVEVALIERLTASGMLNPPFILLFCRCFEIFGRFEILTVETLSASILY